jgi:hypothetical protein
MFQTLEHLAAGGEGRVNRCLAKEERTQRLLHSRTGKGERYTEGPSPEVDSPSTSVTTTPPPCDGQNLHRRLDDTPGRCPSWHARQGRWSGFRRVERQARSLLKARRLDGAAWRLPGHCPLWRCRKPAVWKRGRVALYSREWNGVGGREAVRGGRAAQREDGAERSRLCFSRAAGRSRPSPRLPGRQPPGCDGCDGSVTASASIRHCVNSCLSSTYGKV